MSDTNVALRAAREVQADSLAPELYRQAAEWYFKARQEYKLKNFKNAKEYAAKARGFAEQAEFEAVRNGGNRTEDSAPDPMADQAPKDDAAGKKKNYDYPAPTGTPAEVYEERKNNEEAAKRQQQQMELQKEQMQLQQDQLKLQKEQGPPMVAPYGSGAGGGGNQGNTPNTPSK